MFPDSVRALVLDGAVDPEAGEVNTTGNFGDDYYAEQDFDRTIRVFHELCDASAHCPAGPDSERLLERVDSAINDLPTANFDGGEFGTVGRFEVDDLIFTSMYSVALWPFLAVALKDADDGGRVHPRRDVQLRAVRLSADMEAEPNFDFAHLAIQCADFAGRESASFDCDGFPDTADPLPEIVATDASHSDPRRRHRGRSGDARSVRTADGRRARRRGRDRVGGRRAHRVPVEHLRRRHRHRLPRRPVVPADGTTCPFVVGASTVE